MSLLPRSHFALSEAQTTALIVLTLDLHILYLNPSAQAWMGVSTRSAHGTPLTNHLHPIPPLLRNPRQSFENNRAFTEREQTVGLVHTKIESKMDYTASLVTLESGEHLLLEITPIDSYIRISEESSLQANHAAASALIRGMAHEIKNPLGGIRGAAQLLEREADIQKVKDYTTIIVEETDRLKNLVDRFLYNQPLKAKTAINVHELLERTRHLLTTEFTDIHWLCDYDPSLPDVLGHHDQLLQAFINLARNALEAMSEAGTPNPQLIVRTRAAREVTWLHKRNRLALEVSFIDNGPGIAKELKRTLFFPLVTSRPHGTGLGLSTSMAIIERHQGTICVDRRKNLTLVRVLLPLLKPSKS